jgi:hypothetical protein
VNSQEEEEEELLRKAIAESLNVNTLYWKSSWDLPAMFCDLYSVTVPVGTSCDNL